MGTEAETRLLMQDVLDELLEEEYGKGEEDFLELAGMSEFNRHDDEMGNLIGRIYNQMMGQPFPLRLRWRHFMMPKRWTNGKTQDL